MFRTSAIACIERDDFAFLQPFDNLNLIFGIHANRDTLGNDCPAVGQKAVVRSADFCDACQRNDKRLRTLVHQDLHLGRHAGTERDIRDVSQRNRRGIIFDAAGKPLPCGIVVGGHVVDRRRP